MDRKITTYDTLWSLVDLDKEDHKINHVAVLFLSAMEDWRSQGIVSINSYIKELKEYFGEPLTINKINKKKFDGNNAWELESGSSIVDLIEISTTFLHESDFDKIVRNILDYYEQEYRIVDFVATLKYLTTEQKGRKTPVKSGYRPQVKFPFTEMQTSGQQTFLDKDIVYPGQKVEAKIKIASPDLFENRLSEGISFEFREGEAIIGTGKITYIVNEKLEKKTANIT